MHLKRFITQITASLTLSAAIHAELKLPAIIGNHMVLQQNQADPIWGWDTPGTQITVKFAGQSHSATAGGDGRWTVKLTPLPANSTPQTLTITGSSTLELKDILIGEVWMCSGQSNMEFPMLPANVRFGGDWNGDLEVASADLPNLRLIRAPRVGTQELKNDFKGNWQASTPKTAGAFSAVGFLYGRYLHQILKVPVGLIDNSWGGSSAEAWIRRTTLDADPRFKTLSETTAKKEAEAMSDQAMPNHELAMAAWKQASQLATAENKPQPREPESPRKWLGGQNRAGNIFAGVVHPTIGYGIKGVIWYQGESNSGRAWEYRELFPFLIEQWRKEWGQGDFPFYWVQLADYTPEGATPAESSWAELREAQTMTMRLPNTGQAVIIDLGEGKDIHPKNKHDAAARLVRWPLVKDYGMQLPYRSPEFKKLTIAGDKALVTIDCFGGKLRTFDVNEARGFAICGADKIWHPAKGTITANDQLEVSNPVVNAPIAVRYAWAHNPVCNLFSDQGLPVTPFRTDDFEMVTKPKN